MTANKKSTYQLFRQLKLLDVIILFLYFSFNNKLNNMGLFDSFDKKKKRKEDIKANNKRMAQIQQEIAESKEKVKAMSSEQEELLIQTYGSLDKVPPGMKQTFGIK